MRHGDLDGNHLVAAAAAVQAVDALAAEAEVAAVGCARRDIERRLAVQGLDLDGGSQHGLDVAQGQSGKHRRAVAAEVLVGADLEDHVEVSSRAAAAAVLALTGEAET